MTLPTDPAFYLAPLALITLAVSYIQIRVNQNDLARRQKEIDQKIYETLILREIGERIGYELDLNKILNTIVESLDKLLPFSVVGYMLLDKTLNKVNLRFHLQESVNRSFLNSLREKMLTEVDTRDISESITGTIIDEGLKTTPQSIWTVPLVLNSRGVGVLTIASKNSGLYKGPEMEVLTKILTQANKAVNNLETVLQSEEEKLNSMVAAMADGVLMLDANLSLLVINPAAIRLLGLPLDQKVTILEVVQKLSDVLDLRSKINESHQTNNLVTVDNLFISGTASKLLISPVKDQNKNTLGTVVIFHDVTAQKELDKIRGEFTAMMVHELRAPLTVVRGATDMFLRDPQLFTQQQGQDLLKTMQLSSSTMLNLVNDLLDAAKIEAGKFQIVKIKGNLTETIKERLTFFNQLAMPKNITLTTDVLEENLEVEFDKERISQVLNNLISNAIKFTPMGGKITVSAYKGEVKWRYQDNIPEIKNENRSLVVVSVSDTGTGIPAEKIPDLFSKFKQLKPAESAGTGLGLVIAKGIIESHGGNIYVQSHVDEGTTFYFILPD